METNLPAKINKSASNNPQQLFEHVEGDAGHHAAAPHLHQ
jgi:hypothetical protein